MISQYLLILEKSIIFLYNNIIKILFKEVTLMIIGVQSIHNMRYGLINTETQQIIAPIEFKSLHFQKFGIVATKDDGISSIYTLNGTLISNNVKNPLFLKNDLILISSQEDKCFIWNCSNNTYVFQFPFESIMFFLGTQEIAVRYSAQTNLKQLFEDEPSSMEIGAYVEKHICAKLNEKWGVIDITTKNILEPFIHPVIAQCTNLRIAVRNSDGSTRMIGSIYDR